MLDILYQICFGTIEGVYFSIAGAIAGAGLLGGASIVGGLMGADAQRDANRAAQKSIQKGVDLISQVDIPSIQEQILTLERLYLTGELTPEQEQAILQRKTELENIVMDPQLREAQMEVLSQLDEIVNSGGLDPIAQAQVNELRNNLAQQERSSREAIIQNANRRGVGGSGLELAAQLSSQQGSATRGSQEGFNVAAQAQQRALDALKSRGQMAGDVRTQDYGIARDKASAQDEINRFNIAQRTGAQQRNIDRNLGADEFNLTRQDNLARTNLDIANTERNFNNNLIRQNYLDRMDKAKSQANIYAGQMAQNQVQSGQVGANLWSGIGTAGAKIGGTLLDKALETPKPNPSARP